MLLIVGTNPSQEVATKTVLLQHIEYFAMNYLIKGLEDVQVDNIHLSALVQRGTDKVKHLDQLPTRLSPEHRCYLLPGKQRHN